MRLNSFYSSQHCIGILVVNL